MSDRQADPVPLARAMNAAQIEGAITKYRDAFQATVTKMELRRGALEAAIRIYENQLHSTIVSPVDPLRLARDIYEFLSEPAVKLEPPA